MSSNPFREIANYVLKVSVFFGAAALSVNFVREISITTPETALTHGANIFATGFTAVSLVIWSFTKPYKAPEKSCNSNNNLNEDDQQIIERLERCYRNSQDLNNL